MKLVKIITVLLLILLIIFGISNCAYAGESSDPVGDIMNNAENFLHKDQTIVFNNMNSFSSILYTALFLVGLVIAVIVGIVLGIQYIYSSAEEKAKSKENLFAYVIGCAVLFGAFGIWKIAVEIFNNM